MSRPLRISNRLTRAPVSFVGKGQLAYPVTRIAPTNYEHRPRSVYNINRSVRSTPIGALEYNDRSPVTNDTLLSTTVQSFPQNYKWNSNRTINRKSMQVPGQPYFHQHARILARKNELSCKQKSMLFGLLCTAVLMLITFVLPYILIYFLSQKVTLTMQIAQSSLAKVEDHKYHCGGVITSPSWGVLNINTLSLFVDTSSCKFNSTPLYFTTFSGVGNHFGLASYTAAYAPSKTSFMVFITSLFNWNATYMLSLSGPGQWEFNWLGITY